MKSTQSKNITTANSNHSPFFQKESSNNFFEKNNNPFFNASSIQAKLTVNQPNDPYEKEADAMADKVVQRLSEKSFSNPENNFAPFFNNSNLVMQRKCATPQQKEKLQKKKKEDDKNLLNDKLQKKPIFESNGQPPDGEKKIRRKCAECKEDEKKLQTKSTNNSPQTTSPSIESRLASSKNSGSPLPGDAQQQMEGSFGTDFSSVRIHSNSDAVNMNKQLNAQAFTYGSDIYFNIGKYDTSSKGGQHLLAHELTHVVQQESGVRRADTPVQRSVTATSEVLQRQPTPQQAPPEIKFRIGWFTDEGIPVETNEQVAAIARLVIASLEEGLGDVQSDAVKAQVTEWIATVKGALPYFDQHAGEKVDPALIPLINHQYDQLVEVRAAVQQDKLIQIKEALWREHDAAVKAAEEAEALQPALDDAMRAAYRKGSSSTVKDVVSTVKGALSIGRSLRTLAADITTDIMGLPLASGTKVFVDHWTSQIGTPKITIINVGKYTQKLGNLGRGLSALNVVLTIADRTKKATEAEQGMKDLSDAVNIGTDLISASPLAAPPHFSLYSTLYLKPALKVISQQIGVLVENLSDVNRTAVEVTGDLMYPNAEPGGQEMFDLMVKVMHAEDESGFPALPGGVQEYLFDHRDKLSTGAEAEVPTEGILFWKQLDGPAGRRWLFAHRQRVWAMFYGSMKVPDSKH